MISAIIDALNVRFIKLFEKYPGVKIYGLAQSIIRISEAVVETFPGLVDENGEITNVGLDDSFPAILYHKNGQMISRQSTRNGIGDQIGDIINTFSNTLIVYYDRKRINIMPDELVFILQANMPDEFGLKPFKAIGISFQSVILNSAQVYNNEYQNTAEKALDPGKSMLAINYNVEATFSKSCFSDCLI